MSRFSDSRTRQVCETGLAPGVPQHVGRRAQWECGLLLAAKEWRDVIFIADLPRGSKRTQRQGIHIDGKWYVTFSWDEPIGATDIRLERHKTPPDA